MVMTSPFAKEEREAGASWAKRFGVEVPERYGDPGVEYQAARTSVGLVDFSFRGILELTG